MKNYCFKIIFISPSTVWSSVFSATASGDFTSEESVPSVGTFWRELCSYISTSKELTGFLTAALLSSAGFTLAEVVSSSDDACLPWLKYQQLAVKYRTLHVYTNFAVAGDKLKIIGGATGIGCGLEAYNIAWTTNT